VRRAPDGARISHIAAGTGALPRAGAFLSVFLAACAGPSQGSTRTLHAMLARGDYDRAEAHLRAVKEEEYGRKNAVLYNLDLAMVLHDAGKYKDSDHLFDKAESRMEELYTVSAHQAAGTLLLNDNTMEYAGLPFERALTNAFRAMNYVFLGLPDEALVESRKAELFLDELARSRAQRLAYKDDAFVRYLDSLLYEEAGKDDDARISRQASERAYAAYQRLYGTAPPRFDISSDPRKSGELVLLHYAGVAPRKVSHEYQIAWNEAAAAVNAGRPNDTDPESYRRARNAIAAGLFGRALTVAFPAYVQDPYAVSGSRLEAGGEAADSVLMEDVSAIAQRELQDRVALVRTRAIARAAIKYALANAAAAEMERKQDSKVAGWLTRAVLNAAAAATEVADTRAWASVPAQIRMARLRLAPGSYEVKAIFTDQGGRQVSERLFPNVEIRAGHRTYLECRTAS